MKAITRIPLFGASRKDISTMTPDPNHRALNRDRFTHEEDERPLRGPDSEAEMERGDYEYDLWRDNQMIAELEAAEAKEDTP